MAYPTILRQKALDYYAECNNCSQVAKAFGITRKTLYKWLTLQNTTGSLKHQYKGGNHTKVDKNELLTYIQKHPDAFQYEVAQHLGCSASAVRYQYKILGITRKKKATTYKEQDSEKVAIYQQELNEYTDYQKVYLDETGFNAFLYRPYAYSAKGASVKAKISGKRYQRFSLVAAYVEGQLVAPMTYQQTMDSTLFEAWFEHFLMPSLTEKSLIIMDNARFHRISVLKDIAEQKGHKVLPLPPYSPELNPIEKIWANIKRELRKILPSYSCFVEALLGTFYFA